VRREHFGVARVEVAEHLPFEPDWVWPKPEAERDEDEEGEGKSWRDITPQPRRMDDEEQDFLMYGKNLYEWEEEMYCLLVAALGNRTYFLVLRRISEGVDKYERIGLGEQSYDEDKYLFRGVEEVSFVTVV